MRPRSPAPPTCTPGVASIERVMRQPRGQTWPLWDVLASLLSLGLGFGVGRMNRDLQRAEDVDLRRGRLVGCLAGDHDATFYLGDRVLDRLLDAVLGTRERPFFGAAGDRLRGALLGGHSALSPQRSGSRCPGPSGRTAASP